MVTCSFLTFLSFFLCRQGLSGVWEGLEWMVRCCTTLRMFMYICNNMEAPHRLRYDLYAIITPGVTLSERANDDGYIRPVVVFENGCHWTLLAKATEGACHGVGQVAAVECPLYASLVNASDQDLACCTHPVRVKLLEGPGVHFSKSSHDWPELHGPVMKPPDATVPSSDLLSSSSSSANFIDVGNVFATHLTVGALRGVQPALKDNLDIGDIMASLRGILSSPVIVSDVVDRVLCHLKSVEIHLNRKRGLAMRSFRAANARAEESKRDRAAALRAFQQIDSEFDRRLGLFRAQMSDLLISQAAQRHEFETKDSLFDIAAATFNFDADDAQGDFAQEVISVERDIYLLMDAPVGNLVNNMSLRGSILRRFFRMFDNFPTTTVEVSYPENSTAVASIEADTPVTLNLLEEDASDSLPLLHELETVTEFSTPSASPPKIVLPSKPVKNLTQTVQADPDFFVSTPASTCGQVQTTLVFGDTEVRRVTGPPSVDPELSTFRRVEVQQRGALHFHALYFPEQACKSVVTPKTVVKKGVRIRPPPLSKKDGGISKPRNCSRSGRVSKATPRFQ
jgi:hypothetical protein